MLVLQVGFGLVYFRVLAHKITFLKLSSILVFRPEGQIWDPVRRETKTYVRRIEQVREASIFTSVSKNRNHY